MIIIRCEKMTKQNYFKIVKINLLRRNEKQLKKNKSLNIELKHLHYLRIIKLPLTPGFE